MSVLYWAHLCIICSLGISNFLEEISSLSYSIGFLCFFILITEEGFFVCLFWGMLSYLSLLFFGTLHSNGYIFPFLLCFSHLFFSQLFVRPPRQPFCFFALLFLGSDLITWTTALSNSMKLWATPCGATQDGRVMLGSSEKIWSTGEGNGKPLQYFCLENPMKSMKRQEDRTLKDELSRSVGAQYATGDQWRNNSRKKEEMEPKQKQHTIVDVTGDGSKVWCCKEQYCIGTWNVRSMNQGKLEVIK